MTRPRKDNESPNNWWTDDNPYYEYDTLTPPFWIISDTHFFHRNIVKYCDRPENHDRIMVERWNSVVGEDDIVLHLGDLFMSKRDNYQRFKREITPRLNGRKYLILGNHDDRKMDYKGLGFTPIKPFRMHFTDVWKRPIVVEFSHYPGDEHRDGYLRVHGHIHNNGYAHYSQARRMVKKGNANVSVEVIDYTPQPVTKVIEEALKRDR